VGRRGHRARIRESGYLVIGFVPFAHPSIGLRAGSARDHAEGAAMHHPSRTPVLRFILFILLLPLLAPRLAHAATIRGTVVDPDGAAAGGARVVLTGPLGSIATDRTDAAGAFEFAAVPEGSYELRTALEGFRAEPTRVTVLEDDDRVIPISLSLAAVTEEIVVSASQIDAPLSRIPDSVTVLTAADLRTRQIEDLAAALRLVPGLAVAQYGGRGALTSVFPRGGESDFTLVVIDGVRVNAFGGGFDFGQLPIANVERIEIVRGPQSALFGSDAIGGVVQIVTRRGSAPSIEGVVETGSFDTHRLAVTSAGTVGPFEWGASAERLVSEGLNGHTAPNGETIGNDDFETSQATLSGGWRPRPGTLLRGHAWFASTERGNPGPFGSDPGATFFGVDRISRGSNENRSLSIAAIHAFNSRVTQRAELTYANLDSGFASAFGDSEAETGRLSGRVQTDLAIARGLSGSFGFEAQRERIDNTFVTSDQFEPIPIRRRVVGYFAEARIEPVERVSIATGIRLEHIRRDRLAGNPSGGRPDFADESTLSPNPKIAVAWFLQAADRRHTGWTRVHGSAGTGIRAPNDFEIAFTDNPSLKPERSRSLDLGMEQAFAGGAIVLDATMFANSYDDLIVAVGPSAQSSSRFRTDNISNARARGVELSAAGRTRAGLDARASYTWLDSEVQELDRAPGAAPPPFSVGDPLIRRPRHQARLDVTFARGPVTVYAQVAARSQVLDVDPSAGAFGGLFDAPGFTVAHAGGAVRLGRTIEVFARMINLFDRDYEEALGYPALGRGAHIGIRVAASR
jgi:outer membrane cobalamin receptor